MKHTLFTIALAIFLPFIFGCKDNDINGVIPPPDSEKPIDWELAFEENFDSTLVNQTDWYMYDGSGHDGNGLRKPEAFSVEDGLLVVTAQMKDNVLITGGMSHRQNYTYGKFEFRVRTEPDPSSATSGVVLTWPQSEKWPLDGENDIYETTTSATRNPFHTFIHYGVSNSQYQFIHKADATEWQVMAMVWTADAIRIYRNDKLVYRLTNANAIPQVAHHICIQLDAFKATMGDPVKMYVDWVKIYQAKK